MVDRLSKYEIKLLNKVIFKTTESASFNIFDILKEISEQTSYFDKGHISYSEEDAIRITNFLLDKKLVNKVHPDNPSLERIIKWTEKGVRLKKYKNYYLYKFMTDQFPEISKISLWLGGIIGSIWIIIQIRNSFKTPTQKEPQIIQIDTTHKKPN